VLEENADESGKPFQSTRAEGVAYSVNLVATGGSIPYTWTIVNGSLPFPAWPLNSAGSISGVPTTAGTFSFILRVTDRLQTSAQKSFQFDHQSPAFTISTNSPLPARHRGVPTRRRWWRLTGFSLIVGPSRLRLRV